MHDRTHSPNTPKRDRSSQSQQVAIAPQVQTKLCCGAGPQQSARVNSRSELH